MSNPVRFTSGFTQDASWQPLGAIGIPNPFFYAAFQDDFLPYQSGKYTVTATGGSVAQTTSNGTGGRILFTTGATSGNFAEIQMDGDGFSYTAGKKFVYLTRIQVADITNTEVIAGLIDSTATPFSAVTDGIYFYKAAAGTSIQLRAVTGSTLVGSATITGALTANTDIDLGFYVDRSGNIKAFYGHNLIGQQSQNTATLGPDTAIRASTLTGALTTAALYSTLAVAAGTAAAQTMVSDFLFSAQER